MKKHSNTSFTVLLFSSILGVLVVSTLVAASSFFLRPVIELDLKNKLISDLLKAGITPPVINISGRDITLSGFISNEKESIRTEETAKKVWGVRKVNNHLIVRSKIE